MFVQKFASQFTLIKPYSKTLCFKKLFLQSYLRPADIFIILHLSDS